MTPTAEGALLQAGHSITPYSSPLGCALSWQQTQTQFRALQESPTDTPQNTALPHVVFPTSSISISLLNLLTKHCQFSVLADFQCHMSWKTSPVYSIESQKRIE